MTVLRQMLSCMGGLTLLLGCTTNWNVVMSCKAMLLRYCHMTGWQATMHKLYLLSDGCQYDQVYFLNASCGPLAGSK